LEARLLLEIHRENYFLKSANLSASIKVWSTKGKQQKDSKMIISMAFCPNYIVCITHKYLIYNIYQSGIFVATSHVIVKSGMNEGRKNPSKKGRFKLSDYYN
jgi:hypothetical protein